MLADLSSPDDDNMIITLLPLAACDLAMNNKAASLFHETLTVDDLGCWHGLEDKSWILDASSDHFRLNSWFLEHSLVAVLKGDDCQSALD